MEVGFLIKWLNPIIECQHLFLFVLSFGFNSCIWIFRHFKWVLELCLKTAVNPSVHGSWDTLQRLRKQSKTHFLVCASSLFCHFLIATLSHNRVTHWMESPEQLIFFLKSLFPSEPYSRAFPLTSGTAVLWRSTGRKASTAHTMDGSARPQWKQWGFPKHKTTELGHVPPEERCWGLYLVQGPSSGPSWCGNKAALLGFSLRPPPNKCPSPFPSSQKNSWFLSLLVASILTLENTTSFRQRGVSLDLHE